MSSEIVISSPQINKDKLRAYSCENMHILEEAFNHYQLSPEKYPLVVDLCAGSGCIAKVMLSLGWDSKNLYCIDKFEDKNNLIPSANWHYWDLETLGNKISTKEPLPPEVLNFKEKFDVTLMFFGLTSFQSENVIRFFTKPGGLALTTGMPLISLNPGYWEKHGMFSKRK